jgi:ribosomal protein L29
MVGDAISGGKTKRSIARMYTATTKKYLEAKEEELDIIQKELFLIRFHQSLRDIKPIGVLE